MKLPLGTRRVTINLPKELGHFSSRRGSLTDAIIRGLKAVQRKEAADLFPSFVKSQPPVSALRSAMVLMDGEGWSQFLHGRNPAAAWALRAGQLALIPGQRVSLLALAADGLQRRGLGRALDHLEEIKLEGAARSEAAHYLALGFSQENGELLAVAKTKGCVLLLGGLDLLAAARKREINSVAVES
jgi:hypothetical protein